MEILEDQVDTPEDELKRADHLVYVSLKYTRTCDIMKNAVKRMIAAYELSMDEYLESIRKIKKIKDVPTNYKEKVILVKKLIGSSVNKYLVLYNLLKKINKADYTAIEEFRKNVTLRTKDKKSLDIKVEHLYQYLETTKEFNKFIKSRMK